VSRKAAELVNQAVSQSVRLPASVPAVCRRQR
jgi:hypothetical protein